MLAGSLMPPHLEWVVFHQGPVAWIYVAILACLALRIWLSVNMFLLPREKRRGFLARAWTLSDATGHAALLLGVMGTLVGVSLAVSDPGGNVSPQEFIENFSSSFSVAIGTTLTGGATYVLCLLLCSIDDLITSEAGK